MQRPAWHAGVDKPVSWETASAWQQRRLQLSSWRWGKWRLHLSARRGRWRLHLSLWWDERRLHLSSWWGQTICSWLVYLFQEHCTIDLNVKTLQQYGRGMRRRRHTCAAATYSTFIVLARIAICPLFQSPEEYTIASRCLRHLIMHITSLPATSHSQFDCEQLHRQHLVHLPYNNGRGSPHNDAVEVRAHSRHESGDERGA